MTKRVDEVQLFNRGEIALCYEPDKSKARVLYDCKVLAVYERKDSSNVRYFDYKIHFQGWKPSWDQNVRVTDLLKDNEENRKLQRELAEAAQLQKIGGYSYKDTKAPTLPPSKKKRLTRGGNVEELPHHLDAWLSNLSPGQQQELQHKNARSRDARGARKTQTGKSSTAAETSIKVTRNSTGSEGERRTSKSQFSLQVSSKDTHKTDIDKRVHQEDRVMLRISERLREYMEYDYNMICKLGKNHRLPAHMPIITILENFVKQRAVELAIGIKQDSSRARNTQSRNARMEREYDRVMSNVCMLKEVVDGLRIYFEFHLEDHLLYKEERKYILSCFNDEMTAYCNLFADQEYKEFINPSGETELMSLDGSLNGVNEGDGSILGGIEYEKQLQKCLLYIVKSSGKNNIAHAYDQRTSPYTAAYKLPMEMRGFLCETFNWSLLAKTDRLLEYGEIEKSIIFGAPHLARMLVLLPSWLNASPMSSEKMEILLPHLNSLINYLENHKEWFDKQNYSC